MILTEAEAKTKWCPMASYRNRGGPQADSKARCLASGCMAWRWLARKGPADIEERKNWPLIPNTNAEEPVGYCGA